MSAVFEQTLFPLVLSTTQRGLLPDFHQTTTLHSASLSSTNVKVKMTFSLKGAVARWVVLKSNAASRVIGKPDSD